jgi:hypothetical protein
MSAKDDILAKIKKKASRYSDLRQESKGEGRPIRIIAKIIEAIDYSKATSKTALEFTMAFDREWGMLEHKLKRIDPHVIVEAIWHREDAVESWEDLRLTGVKVIWGEKYKAAHPDELPEETITVERLWMEL